MELVAALLEHPNPQQKIIATQKKVELLDAPVVCVVQLSPAPSLQSPSQAVLVVMALQRMQVVPKLPSLRAVYMVQRPQLLRDRRVLRDLRAPTM